MVMEAEKFQELARSKPQPTMGKKNRSKISRRFNDEQIKSLESMFKLETKLEPRKKLQLARDLGLQPRQVAIWFQNKRARWKSKQLEQEFRVLRANFDNLKLQFESLKKERDSFLLQLRTLNGLLKDTHEGGGRRKGSKVNAADFFLHDDDEKCELTGTSGYLNGRSYHDGFLSANDDNVGINQQTRQEEETEYLNLRDLEDSSLVSAEKRQNLGSASPFDQSCDTSNLWDF